MTMEAAAITPSPFIATRAALLGGMPLHRWVATVLPGAPVTGGAVVATAPLPGRSVTLPASNGTPLVSAAPVAPAPTGDHMLIAAARSGDLDAFNQLVLRYQRPVYNVALRIMRDPAAAEDATQEALIKAWTAIGSFNGDVILPWLTRIVTNRCYDVIRARNRRPTDSLDQDDRDESSPVANLVATGETPAAYVDRAELSVRLQGALETLSDDQRAVVILSDVHGYSYEEIADRLGVAVGTVKSRLCRARARLRAALGATADGMERNASH